VATASPPTVWRTARSLSSSEVIVEAPVEEGSGAGSVGAADDEPAAAEEEEPFDVMEASLQEVHDITEALVTHVRNVHRRLYDKKDVAAAVKLYHDWMDKFIALMTAEVMDAMLKSSSFEAKERRTGGANRTANLLEKHRHFNTNTASHLFKHAPYELKNVRADIPDSHMALCRARRDASTLGLIKRLLLASPANPRQRDVLNTMWKASEHIKGTPF
jgi:hypothetical protein